MIHDVQAHMLPMNVAIAAMIAGRLRRRRRDHAVTRIHDKSDNLVSVRRVRWLRVQGLGFLVQWVQELRSPSNELCVY